MLNYFVYNGHRSNEFGLYISGSGTFDGSEWEIEETSVPGKNGNLILPNKRLKNIELSYPAFIKDRFKENCECVRLWLLGDCKYKKLEDSYDPDCYRMAFFKGPINFDAKSLNKSGEVTLLFNCMPQRWLKSGEVPIAITVQGQALPNQWQPALPLIQLTGTGDAELSVGSSTISIKDMDGSLTIDSDTQNAYEGTKNKNGIITVSGGFPVLATGDTPIIWSGGITAIKITPRWWRL